MIALPIGISCTLPWMTREPASPSSVVDALTRISGVTAGLKWPNDVLVERRKLAGILSEVAPGSSLAGEVAVALGLGVNLTVDDFPPGANAVSLHTLVAEPPDPETLLRAWSAALGPHLAPRARRDPRHP